MFYALHEAGNVVKQRFFVYLLYLISDISNYKKRAAIGSQTQVLPTGAATKPHTAS